MTMDDSARIPFQCHCGYDPTGLDPEGICPECGRRKGERKGRFSAPLWSWRHCGSWCLRVGFLCSVLTLILAVLNSALSIYCVAYLSSGGFKGGTAGFIIIYPPLLWVIVQLPLAIVSAIIVLIGACRSRKLNAGNHGGAMLFSYSVACVVPGLVGSFIVILVSTLLILS